MKASRVSPKRVLVVGFDKGDGVNVGALIIRIGFWGPLYYNYNKDIPKIAIIRNCTKYFKPNS